jgi:N-acetylgalactosamine 4-sulfate 6-O-sulfotransferase
VHVLGVSKCGTTDLYKRMSRHPDFVQSTNKGPHFWDESVSATSGFEQYLALFEPLALRVGSAPAAAAGALLSADASSNTLTAAGVWRRGHNPVGDVTVGELLFEAAPYTRCVAMVREPGARWLSAFHYYRKMFGPEGQATAHDFHEHVTAAIATFQACVGRNKGDAWPCVKAFEPQQLIKGLYAEFLWDWAPRFPREQLLMLRLEDYSADMRRHLSAVFAFVGLREPTEAEWTAILEAPRANTRADRGLLEAERDMMLPETREALTAFYTPFNEALAKALGDERFAWRDVV